MSTAHSALPSMVRRLPRRSPSSSAHAPARPVAARHAPRGEGAARPSPRIGPVARLVERLTRRWTVDLYDLDLQLETAHIERDLRRGRH